MSSATATANGRPRKQLSDQLDRLDGIIDCLADGLTEAVRDAVADGSRAALKDLLAEALADPDTLAALRRALVPDAASDAAPPADRPRAPRTAAFLARVTCAASAAAAYVQDAGVAAARAMAATARSVVGRARRGWAAVRRTAVATAAALALARRLRAAAGVGLAVGLAAVAVALASHPAAVVLSGAGAAGLGFAAHLGLWARTVARRLAG